MIKNPIAHAKRTAARNERRPRAVNYPTLEPGQEALGLRREHGKAEVKIIREPLPQSRSKYDRIEYAKIILPQPIVGV